jgi:HEAT repeat protein
MNTAKYFLPLFGFLLAGFLQPHQTWAAKPNEMEALERDLASTDLGTHQRAAQAIAAQGPAAAAAIPLLIHTLKQDQSRIGFATHEAAKALGKIGAPALPAVLDALKNPDVEMQLGAMDALGELGPLAEPGVPELLKVLRRHDTDYRVSPVAAEAIGKIGNLSRLIERLQSNDGGTQMQTADALGKIGPAQAQRFRAWPSFPKVT